MTDISQDKSHIRTDMRSRLAEVTDEHRHSASVQACTRLIAMDEFRNAHTIMLYMPLASEIDVTTTALRCFQLGKTMCVPRMDWKRKDMIAVEVKELDDRFMDVDEHGIRTPRFGQPVLPSLIDLVVAPGLAFDTKGHRLGRGGGYYDRFLASHPKRSILIGICFDFQIIEHVPTESLDVPLDVVVSDRRTAHTRPLRSA